MRGLRIACRSRQGGPVRSIPHRHRRMQRDAAVGEPVRRPMRASDQPTLRQAARARFGCIKSANHRHHRVPAGPRAGTCARKHRDRTLPAPISDHPNGAAMPPPSCASASLCVKVSSASPLSATLKTAPRQGARRFRQQARAAPRACCLAGLGKSTQHLVVFPIGQSASLSQQQGGRWRFVKIRQYVLVAASWCVRLFTLVLVAVYWVKPGRSRCSTR